MYIQSPGFAQSFQAMDQPQEKASLVDKGQFPHLIYQLINNR